MKTISQLPKPCQWFLLIAMLFASPLFAQDDARINSLKHALNTNIADTTRVQVLDSLASLLPEGEWEEYNEKMEKLSAGKLINAKGKERKVYLGTLASSYNNSSLIFKYKGDIQKALEYGEKSLSLFEELKDGDNIATASYNNGRLYQSLGDISHALQSFEYVLKTIGTSQNKTLLSYCLNTMGVISREQLDFEKAMEYHRKAYAAAQLLKDDEALAYTSTCMGLVRFDQKQYTEARENFSNALTFYERLDDIQNQAAQHYHLGQVANAIHLYDEAAKQYDEALTLYTKRDDKPGLCAVTNAIGQLYFQQGNIGETERYLQKSLTLGRELGFPKYIETPAEGLYKIYRKQGETKKALEMHELFIRMRDSVVNEDTRKKVLKAQYRYEFELKATADSIQTEDEKKILNAQLSEERTQRYGLLIGLVLLLTTAGFGFAHFHARQRLKELKLRNQIASDLHDEVGSAISSISLFAGMARMKQGHETNELVEKIEETSRETINTMSDIVWSIEPANDNFQNVLRRMKQFGEQITAPLNINFQFTAETGIEKLSLDMRQRKNIYLVYKESLNNACKHGQPTSISVTLQRKSGALVMMVSDNGCGFDSNQESSGYGMSSMKARTNELSGNLEIASLIAKGSQITLTVPH